jgi:hypothetical protein
MAQMDAGSSVTQETASRDARCRRIRMFGLLLAPLVCACVFSAWIWSDHRRSFQEPRGPESVVLDLSREGTTLHPVTPRGRGALGLDFRDTLTALRTRQSTAGINCASLVRLTWRTEALECDRVCDASVDSETASPCSGCYFMLASSLPGSVEVRVLPGGQGCGSWTVHARLDSGALEKSAMEEVTRIWPATILAWGFASVCSWWTIRRWRRKQAAVKGRPHGAARGPE